MIVDSDVDAVMAGSGRRQTYLIRCFWLGWSQPLVARMVELSPL